MRRPAAWLIPKINQAEGAMGKKETIIGFVGGALLGGIAVAAAIYLRAEGVQPAPAPAPVAMAMKPASAPAPAASTAEKSAPVSGSTIKLTEHVGQNPTQAFKNPSVSTKFMALLGSDYDHFLKNLSVSTGLEEKGNFYFGAGCGNHRCDSEKSAFTINRVTGDVFAIVVSGGEQMRSFGTDNVNNMPVPLYAWYKEVGGEE